LSALSVTTTRINGNLPAEFADLIACAKSEGIGNMAVLAEEWRSGRERFADPGSLFAAWLGGELAGVGGLTVQPGLAKPAMRMQRLYVKPQARRRRVGRKLASAMIQQGLKTADLFTCNARASAAAPLFWQEMGFAPAPDGYDFTHWMQRT
jgi:GNAT superfamily N-acetyltransferase